MATIALFDGDIIAYRSAAVVEKRKVEVLHKSTGKTKDFDTRTEFKEFLKNKDWVYNEEEYSFRDYQIPEPEHHAFQVAKSLVNKIKEQVDATDIEVYVGDGNSNFRLNLELPELYKGNREDMIRPIHLKATKTYLLDNYPSTFVQDIEVDDYLVVRSHEIIKAGHRPIIITIDKDSWGCVGTEYFNFTDEDSGVISVPSFGYLRYNTDKKKVEGLGTNFYCYQMLAGDKADNYRPNDLHKLRIGDAAVLGYLDGCKTPNELFQVVNDKFKEWFGDEFTYKDHTGKTKKKNYKEILEMYHQCVYMKRKRNDDTTFFSLWEEFR